MPTGGSLNVCEILSFFMTLVKLKFSVNTYYLGNFMPKSIWRLLTKKYRVTFEPYHTFFPPALTNVRKNLKGGEILIGPKMRHVRGQKRSLVRRNVVSKWPSSRKLVKIITCLKFDWKRDLQKKFLRLGAMKVSRLM